MSSKDNKTASLVLGSGGARGLAHIGVVHWLEQHGYDIRSISGCSMGALIGGIYAAGKLDEYEHWVRAVNKVDIVTLLDLSWESSGLVKGDKIINTLIDLVGDVRIEDLPINFTAVATNLKTGKEVWINSGRLFDAIRASISMPLFFTPFRHRDAALIDGGVLNPVPIAPTFSDGTDITIAVSLSGEPLPKAELRKREDKGEEDDNSLRANINSFIKSLKKSVQPEEKFDWGAYDVIYQAFEAMQSTITRQKLAAYPPDVVIEIPRNVCRTLEFDRAAELIELGYDKAAACLS